MNRVALAVVVCAFICTSAVAKSGRGHGTAGHKNPDVQVDGSTTEKQQRRDRPREREKSELDQGATGADGKTKDAAPGESK